MSDDQNLTAQVVREAINNLLELVDQAASDKQTGEVTALREEAQKTMLALIAAIVASDGKYEAGEKAFLNALVSVKGLPGGELEYLRDYAELWGTMGTQVPRFFHTAVEHDAVHKTDIARAMTFEIQLVGTNTCAADGKIRVAEHEVIQNYLTLLDEFLDGRGREQKPAIASASLHSITTTPPRKTAAEVAIENARAELDAMVGLEGVKKQVRVLIDFLKVEKLRQQRGMARNSISLHAVFSGPPGTGKTSVARLLGKIYSALGFLKKGHVIETDRSGMVAGFVGQTALKVDALVAAATDGVLFIDEAYTLKPEGSSGADYGQEAIDVLLKRMEDRRESLVVVVAGYPQEMTRFVESNPGLKSRFNRYFEFDDYSPEHLLLIFEKIARTQGFQLSTTATPKLLALLTDLYNSRDRRFGNGRLARNIFEEAIERQSTRLARIEDVSDEQLKTLEAEDLDVEIAEHRGSTPPIAATGKVSSGLPHPEARSSGKPIDAFLRTLPDFQRLVAEWFIEASAKFGQSPHKLRSKDIIALKEWTASLVFGDNLVTFETGYDEADSAGELAHHVAKMRAVPDATQWLLGPGQPRPAPTYKVEIENSDALRVAKLVFDAFADATVGDERRT